MTPVTVVGDALLDVDWTGMVERICADAPVPVLEANAERDRPGGAGLAAVLAGEAGAAVTLVTALGDDPEGERLRSALAAAGVDVVDLGLQGATPIKLRLRAAGQSLARVDRNCWPVAAVGAWREAATAAVEDAAAVLVSDYGRSMAAVPALSALLQGVRTRRPVVWDPHRRGCRPPAGVDLLTPNLAEAALLAGRPDGVRPEAVAAHAAVARAVELAPKLTARFEAAVAVTAGEAGAVLAEPGGQSVVLPVEPVAGDVCGAGDCFAAAATVARAEGASRREASAWAVERARRHVAGSSSPSPDRPPAPDAWLRHDGRSSSNGRRSGAEPGTAVALAEKVHAAGGTVVAAGGCFDVLHAGHVRLLESARQMGDCLVVCLNGDDSVRRLKGRPRPVNPVHDRIAVLRSLGCVDEILVFEDDTPCVALCELRPDVYVKGTDYADRPLPEQQVLGEWGGQVAFVPIVPGRSTSAILRAAAGAAG